MKCALCQNDRTLCRSHIVPDFSFRHLLKDERRYITYSGKENKVRDHFSTMVEKLLCEKCESIFSKWESYAAPFFGGKTLLSGEKFGKHWKLSGAEYAPLKLYLMSLLWRFGITSNPWLKGCQLGAHKERLRKYLLAQNPGEAWRYGCSIGIITLDNEHLPDLIVPPSSVVIDGQQYQRLIVGGFLLSFLVASHAPKRARIATFLQQNGDFIFSKRELHEIPFLEDLIAGVVNYPPENALEQACRQK